MPCSTCRHFDLIVTYEDDEAPDDAGVPESICRRFPPLGEGWTLVLADDWCGEFEAAHPGRSTDA